MMDEKRFFSWQKKNKYYGKQFAIFGDSISTLEGYNPSGYKVFYVGENSKKSCVTSMQDTWWGKVISYFGGELLVNNSWSGSRVTKLPDRSELFPSGCSDERTAGLHINKINPDVIIVYLGTNDWGSGAKIKSATYFLGDEDDDFFSYAYENMLKKLISNYPQSEIWCCTLNETYISKCPNFVFPHSYAGTHIEEYNNIIRKIVQKNDCKLIDLYSYRTPYDSIDGSHPTSDGMSTIAEMVICSMIDLEDENFLKNEIGNHTNLDAKKYGKDVTESEYIMLDSNETFYTNTIKLTIESSGKMRCFQNDVIEVGRDAKSDLSFEDRRMISRKHATFLFEKDKWYLIDHHSKNGTWLNGVRIEPEKKYQLQANDIVDFAKNEKVIFHKYEMAELPSSDIDKKIMKCSEKRMAILEKKQDDVALDMSRKLKDKYIGTLIADRYYVDKLLEKDNFYKTYLVEDVKLQNTWAMKVCDKTNKNYNNFFRDAILREFDIMKKLSHPVIPLVVNVLEEEDGILVFKEHIEGESLEMIVQKDGVQSVDKVIGWAKELCDMLIYMHNQTPPHIYRDMKPANVIYMKNHHLKVIDFGLVRMYDLKKKQDTCYLGTRGYAAPEQYGCNRQTDARTDIFGLGMTMHYLVTGIDPKNPSYVIKPICEINPDLPKGLEYIISKCVEVNPDNRYQNVTDLLNDLDNYLELPKQKNIFRKLFDKKNSN